MTTTKNEAIVQAVLDGLKRPTGKVANGPTLARPAATTKATASKPAPVLVKRPAIHDWTCDDCHTTGNGLPSLTDHFQKRGHRIYTREEDR